MQINNCQWYVVGGTIKDSGGFVIKRLQKKHDCRQIGKPMNMTSKWIVEKIRSKVIVDPHEKISSLCINIQFEDRESKNVQD